MIALAVYPSLIGNAGFAKHKIKLESGITSPSGEFTVLKSAPGAEFRKEALGSFVLLAGTVLIEVEHDTEIRIEDCQIKARGGSTLLITLKNNVGSVSDLTEKADQSIDIVYGKRSLHLRSGRQVWFGAKETDVATAIREAPGAPKLLRRYDAPEIGIIEEYLFSPATVMDTNDLILTMKDSAVSSERQLYADIVKTSAALTMVHP